jgi:F-type H+-transporting ATPase subunit delta
MRDRRVALRYAQALLAVAAERGLIDDLDETLAGLVQIADRQPELGRLLQNPQVPLPQKKDLLRKLFADRVEPVLLQFLELLLDKGRIVHLREIQTTYAELVEQHEGLQRATAVTAVPLPDDLAEQLARKLAALTGRQIILEQKVDPSVIGGVCVTMGDQILDGTLRTGLRALRDALETAPLRMS